MRFARPCTLIQSDLDDLRHRQDEIDSFANYEQAVSVAKERFRAKPKALFQRVRNALSLATGDLVRCIYCEDSCADEVEHVWPKDFYPGRTFDYRNFLFACGICNPAKNNKFAIWDGESWIDLTQHRRLYGFVKPSEEQPKFIDPLAENPLDLMWLDITALTMMLVPIAKSGTRENDRAKFTIDVLRLNREVIVKARENAYYGFIDRIEAYAGAKMSGADKASLDRRLFEIMRAPHQTVRIEIGRQYATTPLSAVDFAGIREVFI